eukprot:5070793-Amphidinium_carterae.1
MLVAGWLLLTVVVDDAVLGLLIPLDWAVGFAAYGNLVQGTAEFRSGVLHRACFLTHVKAILTQMTAEGG